METSDLQLRRLIFATALTAAVAVVPAVATFAGTPSAAPRNLAQATECPPGQQLNPENQTCAPIVGGYTAPGGEVATPNPAGGGGAPSEGALTEGNPGVGSPTHHGG